MLSLSLWEGCVFDPSHQDDARSDGLSETTPALQLACFRRAGAVFSADTLGRSTATMVQPPF